MQIVSMPSFRMSFLIPFIQPARWRAWRIAILAAALLCVCSNAGHALQCDRPAIEPPLHAASQPGNLGVLKLRLLRYACSDAYDRDVRRALKRATSYLERRAHRVRRPAIVLDIDETALSNWPEIVANDFGYIPEGSCDAMPQGPCGWRAWVKAAKAEPIKPTLNLFKAARAKGVAVFFLTGRRDRPNERAATERNLREAGYDSWAALLMRSPDDHRSSAASYKAAERAQIEAQGYRIIVNVGDQQSDLDGGHAERGFLVPNPFYFIR
jgi:acid phosphatase